jgi:chorismate lyase/3-hydroxybenzoate synthase
MTALFEARSGGRPLQSDASPQGLARPGMRATPPPSAAFKKPDISCMKSSASADLASQAPATSNAAPLTFRRLRLADGTQPQQGLGGREVGAGPEAIAAPLLVSATPMVDAWFGGPATEVHQHGSVRYVTDGHWVHGCAVVDDRAMGVHAAAEQAYADVFAVLAATPSTHLLRLWNYLADINADAAGTERYRQFNAGRQQAFLDAKRSAFEGSPAACALGTHGGPLRVYFLAGRTPPVAIENPRQVSAYRYPDTYGPRAPTFSRAALADIGGARQALFISGTASIVGHQSLHEGDVRRQTEESLTNLSLVREAAAARAGQPIAAGDMVYTVYIRHPADLPVVREVFERAVGANSIAAREAIYLNADICRAELLVEIEAHGFIDHPRSAA